MPCKPIILIVDDDFVSREMLKEILKDDYEFMEADNGEDALKFMNRFHNDISLVLLDIVMPGLDGFQVLERFEITPTRLPVIILTSINDPFSETRGFSLGAVDFISKPFNAAAIKARVETHIRLKQHEDNLSILVDKAVAKIDRMQDSVLSTLASVIEYRSVESGDHIKRTRELTALLINKLCENGLYVEKYGADLFEQTVKASILHDIGKIGIRDNILLKPGRLTPEEFDEIKKHSIIGEDIADKFFDGNESSFVDVCKQVCRSHHEKWDGSGYPDGLKGDDIPLPARIVAIVDVYDALLSERVYKKSFSQEEAFEIIQNDSGKHFEPVMVDTLLKLKYELKETYGR